MKSYVLIAVAASLGVMSAVLSTGAAVSAAPAAQIPIKTNAESQAKAKKLYQMDCALCHGDKGNGQTDIAKEMSLVIPDWTDGKTIPGMSDKDLFDIVRNGKDKMPAEGAGRAKDDEVWNLVVYIRTLSKAAPAPAPVPAQQGQN